jgi:glycosyltransferase involved in cell wall biosynthesis
LKLKIALISSGQPSLNPRLVKEADAFSDAGYEVTVLYAYWNSWATEYDTQLLANKKWRSIRVGGDPIHGKIIHTLSRVINKVAKIIIPFTNVGIIEVWALARATYFLIRITKKHKADLYIAHNLGALPAAVIAAKANQAQCGFDAEDFHRYETSDDNNNADVALKIRIENKYIPQLGYFTASSPQIALAYQGLYPDLNPVVLLNVFKNRPGNVSISENNDTIKLFWFSQTIGAGRGLEDIIKALQLVNSSDFELHLLGDQPQQSQPYINAFMSSGVPVKLYKPVHPDEVINFASQFDIGLALEDKTPLNRDICLTNKIFTYMQAGLVIVASDTIAQQDFIGKNPQIGNVYVKGNINTLADILLKYQQDKNLLKASKIEALRLARQQYNWETESQKLLTLVKATLAINE